MAVRDRTSQVGPSMYSTTRRSMEIVEVAFVGKAPGTYSMLLGGGYYGQRMNKIYRGKPVFGLRFL
jgi:hypothetical protein